LILEKLDLLKENPLLLFSAYELGFEAWYLYCSFRIEYLH